MFCFGCESMTVAARVSDSLLTQIFLLQRIFRSDSSQLSTGLIGPVLSARLLSVMAAAGILSFDRAGPAPRCLAV